MKHRRWIIVWKKKIKLGISFAFYDTSSFVYLRRKTDPWGELKGAKEKNMPIMVFEDREEAMDFVAGLVLTTPEIADQKEVQVVKYF